MTRADDQGLVRTIATLARDATPVRPLASPAVRLARWVVAALGASALVVGVLGLRADVVGRASDPAFAMQAGVLAALTLAAAGNALRLAIPGAARVGSARATTLTLTLAWLAVVLWPAVEDGLAWPTGWADVAHVTCAARIAAVGMLPGIVLLFMVRAAAPLDLRWAAASLALAGAGLGALGTQFICMDDATVHVLAWHALPVAVVVGVGAALGRRLLR